MSLLINCMPSSTALTSILKNTIPWPFTLRKRIWLKLKKESRSGWEEPACPRTITNGGDKFRPFLPSMMWIPMKRPWKSFTTCSTKEKLGDNPFLPTLPATTILPLPEGTTDLEWLLALSTTCLKITATSTSSISISTTSENLSRQFLSTWRMWWWRNMETGASSWWETTQGPIFREPTRWSGVPFWLKRGCTRAPKTIPRTRPRWW